MSDRLDDPRPDDALQTAARALARSARLAVFTGAGVSKESGIPTFREPETGLWARYDPMQLATAEAYRRDPAFVWTWYEHRFGVAAEAEPNPGHSAIAELEELLPKVVVITQNIDGLHQRAGSSHVIELHGTMHSFRCIEGRHRGYAGTTSRTRTRSRRAAPSAATTSAPRSSGSARACRRMRINAAQQLSAALRRDARRRHLRRGLPRGGHADDRQGGRRDGDRREPGARRAAADVRPLTCGAPAARCCRSWSSPSGRTWARERAGAGRRRGVSRARPA